MSLRAGENVLVPDLEQAYVPAVVVQPPPSLSVRLADGSTRAIPAEVAASVVVADPQALQGAPPRP